MCTYPPNLQPPTMSQFCKRFQLEVLKLPMKEKNSYQYQPGTDYNGPDHHILCFHFSLPSPRPTLEESKTKPFKGDRDGARKRRIS